MAEVLQLARVAAAYPGTWLINVLAYHQTHVDVGRVRRCTTSSSPRSRSWSASRCRSPSRAGSPRTASARPSRTPCGGRCCSSPSASSCGRSGRQQTNFTFEDTLSQIGLGYPFLFLLATQSTRRLWVALALDPRRLLARLGAVSGCRPRLRLRRGRRACRLAASLQRLDGALEQEHQPRARLRHVVPEPVPAREAVCRQPRRLPHAELHPDARDDDPRPDRRAVRCAPSRRAFRCAGCSSRGRRWSPPASLLHSLGISPVVKRIWTPAWMLFSGGLCFLLLAGFSWVIDMKGYRRWAFPLVVIGLNSIAAYVHRPPVGVVHRHVVQDAPRAGHLRDVRHRTARPSWKAWRCSRSTGSSCTGCTSGKLFLKI